MRKESLLCLAIALLPSLMNAQEMSRLNALSYSTNPLRPLVGILDLNVNIPTKLNQALVAGAHHYSYFYDYTRPDRAGELNYLQNHTEEEYYEWVMGNVISLDYRFYRVKTKRNGRKVGRYFTVLNRIPIVKWNYSRDIIVNPDYTNWYDQNYDPNNPDPEWIDGAFDAPIKLIPASYTDLNTRFTVPYRIGFEVGRKRMSTDSEKRMFNELGIAVFFGRVNGLTYGLPVLTYRLGLNHQ